MYTYLEFGYTRAIRNIIECNFLKTNNTTCSINFHFIAQLLWVLGVTCIVKTLKQTNGKCYMEQ